MIAIDRLNLNGGEWRERKRHWTGAGEWDTEKGRRCMVVGGGCYNPFYGIAGAIMQHDASSTQRQWEPFLQCAEGRAFFRMSRNDGLRGAASEAHPVLVP